MSHFLFSLQTPHSLTPYSFLVDELSLFLRKLKLLYANSLLNPQIYLHQQQLSPSLLLQWRKYLFPVKGQFFLKCSGSDFVHFLKDCISLVLLCLYCIINVSHTTKSFTSCEHALASPKLQNIKSNNNLPFFLPIYLLFFVCLFC